MKPALAMITSRLPPAIFVTSSTDAYHTLLAEIPTPAASNYFPLSRHNQWISLQNMNISPLTQLGRNLLLSRVLVSYKTNDFISRVG
jgi:hypothetical protein